MKAKQKDLDLNMLFDAVLSLKDKKECAAFFDDLFTVPELKAVSQRLEVAKMLDENKVYSEIVATTGASTATISRVNRSLIYGKEGYRIILDRLER